MRVALFVDEANVYFSQRTLGWNIDFKKIYSYFDDRFAMYNAFFYAPEPPDEEKEDEKRKLYQELSLMGYTLRLKKLKEIKDKTGKVVMKKANLDIEMAVDMFATLGNYDIAVLFTGDSDFVRAVELLRMHGKQIFVFSTKGHSSMEIINAADRFFDFKTMEQLFSVSAADISENTKENSKEILETEKMGTLPKKKSRRRRPTKKTEIVLPE